MKMMKRRDFSVGLAGLGLAVAQLPALAQNKPLAAADFSVIEPPAPVSPEKIEVIEFFWYGCPHCFAFEPALDAWAKKLAASPDVHFKRVPVALHPTLVIHQRLFYALESMGKLEAMHRKVFDAMHKDKIPLEKDEDVIEFMAKNGLPREQFAKAFTSFAVNVKTKQATRQADAYRIESVPTLGVHGRFTTSAQQAGSPERALSVTSQLIERARKGA